MKRWLLYGQPHRSKAKKGVLVLAGRTRARGFSKRGSCASMDTGRGSQEETKDKYDRVYKGDRLRGEKR